MRDKEKKKKDTNPTLNNKDTYVLKNNFDL